MKKKYIDDYELIYLVLQGNEKALEDLIEKYKGMMYRIFYLYKDTLKEKFDVNELYQIATISLYNSVLSYNENMECSFLTYLRVIIHRDILAYIRMLKRDRSLANLYSISLDQIVRDGDGIYMIDMVENNQGAFNPPELLNLKELGILIEEVLSQFPKNEQEIFNLWYQGFSYEEIALITGCNIRKISYMLSKIKNKLKGSIDSAYTL